ncbi:MULTISPECIES: alpha/beta hydrolase [Exiguobacterium]|uniref:alpha/beta hydrolase n=1 Tax=Exiguobacterium TaxID=33986 RepID=UPI001BE61E12|nr:MULTISPECIES: alpha/beta hydrolase [Exiguobacterium]MCT4784007.1 alpha/beta hydrolase [Exiguobacterium himgiriensis]
MATLYDQLVRRLAEWHQSQTIDGVETITKPIPDSDVPGDLDPRVLNTVRTFVPSDGPNTFDLVNARASMGWPNRDVTTTVITTEHVTIPGLGGDVSARMYRPDTNETLPAILFFHGGGFFGGTLDTVENPCKRLAEQANALVISVDYRLAPEHPFPAGLNDCFRAVEWVHERADELGVSQNDIAVAGDSAGGNLATACCLLDRLNETNMIRFQALIYPVVNLGSIPTDDYNWDIGQYEIGHNHELIQGVVTALADSDGLLNKLYLQGKADVTDPLVSPLFAEDVKGLPPALIITAEYDYLRLEGEAYARKLARDGVNVRLIQYRGMDHAFMDKIGDYPQAEDCMTEIAKALKEMTT